VQKTSRKKGRGCGDSGIAQNMCKRKKMRPTQTEGKTNGNNGIEKTRRKRRKKQGVERGAKGTREARLKRGGEEREHSGAGRVRAEITWPEKARKERSGTWKRCKGGIKVE